MNKRPAPASCIFISYFISVSEAGVVFFEFKIFLSYARGPGSRSRSACLFLKTKRACAFLGCRRPTDLSWRPGSYLLFILYYFFPTQDSSSRQDRSFSRLHFPSKRTDQFLSHRPPVHEFIIDFLRWAMSLGLKNHGSAPLAGASGAMENEVAGCRWPASCPGRRSSSGAQLAG